jgi:hypothetical protein
MFGDSLRNELLNEAKLQSGMREEERCARGPFDGGQEKNQKSAKLI